MQGKGRRMMNKPLIMVNTENYPKIAKVTYPRERRKSSRRKNLLQEVHMANNLAYICSPYRGNFIKRFRNILYARYLTKVALDLGYTPITTHLYLTQVLDDENPIERRRGLVAGKDILNACDIIIIGTRYGISEGMKAEIEAATGKTAFIAQ